VPPQISAGSALDTKARLGIMSTKIAVPPLCTMPLLWVMHLAPGRYHGRNRTDSSHHNLLGARKFLHGLARKEAVENDTTGLDFN